jgi:hypothetical protein
VRNDGTLTVQAGSRVSNQGLISNNGTLNVFGFLSIDGGGIVQSPTGRLVVQGELSTAAGLRLDGGSFSGSGTVTGALVLGAGTTLLPGSSPGTLTVNGPLTLESGARLELEIDARGAHDTLRAGEFWNTGGTVAISFVDGVVPDIGVSSEPAPSPSALTGPTARVTSRRRCCVRQPAPC